MNREQPLSLQISALWSSATGWIADHTISITIATLIGIAIVALLYGIRLIGIRLGRNPNKWRGVIGRGLASMHFWFMAVLAAQIIATYAHAPADLASTIKFIFVIATTFQVALFLRELILGAVELRAGHDDNHGSLSSALGLIRLLVSIVLFVMSIILILSNVGVNVTGLIAGLGVGGIAIGLAAQGIFADLFAALAILFDKPFRIGDTIRWEGNTGVVEAIGLKTTRVRALTGEEIVISNTNLLSKPVINQARNERRRIIQTLTLKYDMPGEKFASVQGIVRDIVEAVPNCHFVRCLVEGFTANGIDFQMAYDVSNQQPDAVSIAKHAVNLGIIERFSAEGIIFYHPA
jgi:small-conductance mechanosensitive channel